VPLLAIVAPLAPVAALAGLAALGPDATIRELDGNRCVVKVRNLTKLLALRSTIHLSARDIVGVEVVEGSEHSDGIERSVRELGTSIPFVIHAGRFRRGPRREFWAFRPGKPYLRVDVLTPEFRVLRLRVDDPDATVELLQRLAEVGREQRRTETHRAAVAEPRPSSILDNWERFAGRRHEPR
jgi:hypothetical protein